MRYRPQIPVLIALAVTLAPALARSAPPAGGEDEVDLKNGGMLRGTIVSIEPNKEVVILVQGTGEQRRVPWAEVDKVERGKNAGKAAPPAQPKAKDADDDDDDDEGDEPKKPALTAPRRGAPRLHIESEKPVNLQEVTMTLGVVGPGGSAYGMFSRSVCVSPCDEIVDGRAGQSFFFAGDGIPASGRFQLSDKHGDVFMHVDPGSTGLRVGGIGLISLGGVAVITGGSLLLVGSVFNSSSSITGVHSSALPTAGGVTLGIGAAMLAGGIVMAAVSGTKYSFRDAATGALPGVIRF